VPLRWKYKCWQDCCFEEGEGAIKNLLTDINIDHLKIFVQIFILKLNTSLFRTDKNKISISGINI
jgi:hypothetical protein